MSIHVIESQLCLRTSNYFSSNLSTVKSSKILEELIFSLFLIIICGENRGKVRGILKNIKIQTKLFRFP